MAQEYVIQNQGAVILESDGGFIVEEGNRTILHFQKMVLEYRLLLPRKLKHLAGYF